MKKLVCLLAFLVVPMIVAGQDNGSQRSTGTDPKPQVQTKVTSEYKLEKQKVITKPDIKGCAEDGVVVLTIEVSAEGKVVKATIARGTNASTCLIEKAKAAALVTKFEASTLEKQVGTITYRFKITD